MNHGFEFASVIVGHEGSKALLVALPARQYEATDVAISPSRFHCILPLLHAAKQLCNFEEKANLINLAIRCDIID